jgi:hypothetical protein
MHSKFPLYLFIGLCLSIGSYLLMPQSKSIESQPAPGTMLEAVDAENADPQLRKISAANIRTLQTDQPAADEAPAGNKQELAESLAAMTSFTVDELLLIEDLQGFADRFLNLATAGLFTDSQISAAAPVNFAVTPATAGDYMAFTNQFSAGTTRIYANFSTVNYPYRSVLAKWHRIDAPELYSFDRHNIDTEKAENHVWHELPGGWSSGEYRLEIFSTDEQLLLLASGDFWVSN